MEMNKICYFGTYSKEELRNRLNIRMLSKKYSVTEIQADLLPFSKHHILNYLFSVLGTLRRLGRELKKTPHDAIFVGYPGIFSAIIARKFSSKPLIFDPFISIYESTVFDYKTVKEKSLFGRIYFKLEKMAFKRANLVIADTIQHKELYQNLFHITAPIHILPVGNDLSEFLPRLNYQGDATINIDGMGQYKPFIVQFIGSYIPLQGVPFIIESAIHLQKHSDEILFEIIGGTPEKQQPFRVLLSENKVTNVTFIDPVPFAELPELISRSDIQLGIFGENQKSQRVIPKKAILAISMGKPLISGETEAMQQHFTHEHNIFFCSVANSKDLADAILFLYENPALRGKIALQGELTYEKYFSEEVLTPLLHGIVKNVETP